MNIKIWKKLKSLGWDGPLSIQGLNQEDKSLWEWAAYIYLTQKSENHQEAWILLINHADVNALDGRENPPLLAPYFTLSYFLARPNTLKLNTLKMAASILKKGANPNLQDNGGNTPLLRILNLKQSILNVELLQPLFEYGANPNILSHFGDSCLSFSTNQNFDIFDLIQSKCTPILFNKPNKEGDTPLSFFVKNAGIQSYMLVNSSSEKYKIYQTLLEKGSNLEWINHQIDKHLLLKWTQIQQWELASLTLSFLKEEPDFLTKEWIENRNRGYKSDGYEKFKNEAYAFLIQKDKDKLGKAIPAIKQVKSKTYL